MEIRPGGCLQEPDLKRLTCGEFPTGQVPLGREPRGRRGPWLAAACAGARRSSRPWRCSRWRCPRARAPAHGTPASSRWATRPPARNSPRSSARSTCASPPPRAQRQDRPQRQLLEDPQGLASAAPTRLRSAHPRTRRRRVLPQREPLAHPLPPQQQPRARRYAITPIICRGEMISSTRLRRADYSVRPRCGCGRGRPCRAALSGAGASPPVPS